jgi:hypothetical protein
VLVETSKASTLTDAYPYAVRHNPWTFFSSERRACLAYDRDTAAFADPAFLPQHACNTSSHVPLRPRDTANRLDQGTPSA